ncbi:MAG: (2Fe-2S)-binding protein [Saprospiraceae bacterium]|nr:(2Fe-2S)-binding protein [Saprospiraceae bacterium]
MASYTLLINGKSRTFQAEPDTPLLWVLRDELGLTGTKYGCGKGFCGACTVHLNNSAIRSCSIPVSAVTGPVTTIEGLSEDGTHPLQKMWMEVDVPQCGYCQAGQIMSADCWTTILNRYNGSPRFNIQTPQSRNAIVGRLPDSGVPIARVTSRNPWTRQAASFIPVFSWKPKWHFEDSYQVDECDNLKLRILYFGEPEDDARVTIKNSTGRTILQGYTGKKDNPYRYGLRQEEGEIIIRGAHRGDLITVSSIRLLIIETIQVSGEYLTLEINFEGWQGGSF